MLFTHWQTAVWWWFLAQKSRWILPFCFTSLFSCDAVLILVVVWKVGFLSNQSGVSIVSAQVGWMFFTWVCIVFMTEICMFHVAKTIIVVKGSEQLFYLQKKVSKCQRSTMLLFYRSFSASPALGLKTRQYADFLCWSRPALSHLGHVIISFTEHGEWMWLAFSHTCVKRVVSTHKKLIFSVMPLWRECTFPVPFSETTTMALTKPTTVKLIVTLIKCTHHNWSAFLSLLG